MNESFSKAMNALDSAEESRIMLAERKEELDKQRLKMEEECFEAERTAAQDRNAQERRRVELEELRFTQEAKRAEESSIERHLNLGLQKSMLDMLREMRSK